MLGPEGYVAPHKAHGEVSLLAPLDTQSLVAHPFADYYGHLLKETRTVDVIIVAISSIKNASDGLEEMSPVDYNKKCINDVLEAAIHFNAKNVVTTPVWCKQTDCTANQDLWEKGSTSKRVTDNIRRIDLITPKSGIDVRYF